MVNKKRFFRFLLFLTGTALIFYTFYLIAKNFGSIREIAVENPYILLVNMLFLVPINIYATGRLFDVALKNVLKIDIKKSESFGLSSLARFGNYISFGQVGFVIRVLYLKKIHAIKTSDSIVNLGAGNLIFYLFSILLAFTIIYSNNLDSFSGDSLRGSLIVLVSFVFLILLILKSNIIFKSRLLKSYSVSFKKLIKSKKTILDFIFWSFIMTITFTAMLTVEFAVLGENIGIVEALFITSIANLASIINITPAGLGVSEGLLLLAGNAIGISPEFLIASAVLRRFVVFLFITLSSIHFSRKLFNKTLLGLISTARKQV